MYDVFEAMDITKLGSSDFVYVVGKDGITSIRQHSPESKLDEKFYDVFYDNSTVIRVFDYYTIEFAVINKLEFK